MTETEHLKANLEAAVQQLQGVVLELAEERETLQQEIRRLRELINTDRTGLADGLGKVLQLCRRYGDWIRQGHWGNLEVEERTAEVMRRDFTNCLDAIENISSRSLRDSGDRADSAFRDGPSIPFKLEPS